MPRDALRETKHGILVALAFALLASIFNHLLRPLLYLYFVRPPSERFLLMEAPGLALGTACTILFWTGRGLAQKISIILTALGAILGLYIIIFGVVVPERPPESSRDKVTFVMLALVALDCWLCLGFLAVVEMMTGRLGMGEA